LPALVDGGFDWVDVRDVVHGARRAAAQAASGARYILSGHQASLRDLAQLVQAISGTRAPRFVVPMWLARIGVAGMMMLSRANGKRALYTPAALRPLRSNSKISHARATRDLDYDPRPLKETIADTLKWFSDQDDVYSTANRGRRK
jgi:dihydroflavonol-4-reductase